jgi:hypothetical protein
MAKKWTAVSYDLSKKLNDAVKPQRVEIPAGWLLQIVADIDDATYAKLIKNPTLIAKVQQKANEKAKAAIALMEKKIKEIDGKAVGFDPKTALIFTNDLNATVKQTMEAVGKTISAEVDRMLAEYAKGQSDLRAFRAKSAAVITLKAAQIAVTTAAAVASHGALAPLAIVGIAKQSVAITVELAKLGASSDQVIAVIKTEFAVLKKFMVTNLAAAKTSGKVAQSVKEGTLNLLSGALGIPLPSLANLESNLKTLNASIAKLEAESKKYSKGLYAVMDKQEVFANKYKNAKKTLPAVQVGKIDIQLKKVEATLNGMIESTIKVNQKIEAGREAYAEFVQAYKQMHDGVPGWVSKLDIVGGLAFSFATDFGTISHEARGGLATLQVAEAAIDAVAR